MPVPDTDRPPADPQPGVPRPPSGTGRHHSRRRPSPNTSAAVLLGAVGTAVAVVVTVAMWPSPRPASTPLPDLAAIPTVSPPPADLGVPGTPTATPPTDLPATAVPPAAPPLPAPASTTPSRVSAPPSPPRPAPPPPIRPLTIEAEAGQNTLSGRAGIHNLAEASGGHTIGFIGRGSANTLRINDLLVPVAGTYTITVDYVSGDGDRTATIRVNGRLIGQATFPDTGDWSTVDSLAMRINLTAGTNSLEFGNPSDPAPDIDRVILSS
ncbi:CBM35 domain-containing protein [Planosporangium sp. 12N6]|uniref:CBM35 domain-containing protein n=1 Tax=Planosporangium spinosum TaxID=3402278 RepID=UPI003CF1C56F